MDKMNSEITEPLIIQEWNHTDNGSLHRLRNTQTNVVSAWTSYRYPAYLQGMVGHTAYFGTHEGVVTPDTFVRLMAGAETGDGSV